MPLNSPNPLSPSIVSAVVRFRRVIVVFVVVFALIMLMYTAFSGSKYTGKAGLVLVQPPSVLHPFFGSGTSRSTATYTEEQEAVLQSQPVSDEAAAIVNAKVNGAHLTGAQVHAALTIKPQTGASATLNPTTQVLVTMGNAELAAASANAIIEAYVDQLHGQIRAQAAESIAALNKSIAQTNSELSALPASSRPTTTTTSRPPRTTTTRPPRTTTTRPARTTTTRPPRTTTTKANSTTTSSSSTTTTAAAAPTPGNSRPSVTLTAVVTVDATSTSSSTTTTTAPTSTTTTTSPLTTTTTTTTGATSTSNAATAAQRSVLLNTLLDLSRSKQEVLVDEQADLASQMTVSPATIPTAPVNGNYLRNVGIGVFLGLLLGAIAAYALAVSRQQFERVEEPELFYEVPLIALIPAFTSAAWLPTALPVLEEPQEETAEAFRVIATALRSLRDNGDALLVAMSAAAPRSGTTTTVANVGLALAQMGERILVIDGDPVGRGLTHALTDTDLDHHLHQLRPGFSEVIGGRSLMDTVVPAQANERLTVLTSGMDPDLAINRWSSQQLQLALSDARSQFDIVLIDVPPVGSSSYGIDLVAACEALMLVVPYLDPVKFHIGLPDRLRLSGIHLLGYIFNGAPSTGKFAPYFPILHSAELANGAVPIAASRSALVASGDTSTTRHAGTLTGPGIVDDITTVVRASPNLEDPVTSEQRAVDFDTRENPVVPPESGR